MEQLKHPYYSKRKFTMTAFVAFFVISLGMNSIIHAQNPASASLTWEIEQTETHNGTETIYQCKFETSPASVWWVQKGGGVTAEYSITSKEGTWNDVRYNGSIILNLQRNGKPVKMTIAKDVGQYLIHLDFTVSGTVSRRTFQVKNVGSH